MALRDCYGTRIITLEKYDKDCASCVGRPECQQETTLEASRSVANLGAVVGFCLAGFVLILGAFAFAKGGGASLVGGFALSFLGLAWAAACVAARDAYLKELEDKRAGLRDEADGYFTSGTRPDPHGHDDHAHGDHGHGHAAAAH